MVCQSICCHFDPATSRKSIADHLSNNRNLSLSLFLQYSWMSLKYPMKKQLRVSLASMYYELAVMPGLDPAPMGTASNMVLSLLKWVLVQWKLEAWRQRSDMETVLTDASLCQGTSLLSRRNQDSLQLPPSFSCRPKKLVSIHDLRLPWRPLLDMLQKELFPKRRKAGHTWVASLLLGTRSAAHSLASFPANRNISTFLLDMAEVSQRFFHPGDVDEMLAKILPSLHGDDIDVSLRFFLDNRRMLHPHKSCMIYSSDTQEKVMLPMCFFVFLSPPSSYSRYWVRKRSWSISCRSVIPRNGYQSVSMRPCRVEPVVQHKCFCC